MATISEALTIAIQCHQAGRLQAAEQIYRQILQAQPNHADAWHLLGVIAHQGSYRRAIELKPDFAEAHNSLAVALKDQRKPDEPIAGDRRDPEPKPDDAEPHYNLGNALCQQGKTAEAVACYRRAIELKSNFAEAHNNLGDYVLPPGETGRSRCLLSPCPGTQAGLCRGAQQPALHTPVLHGDNARGISPSPCGVRSPPCSSLARCRCAARERP